MLHKYEGMPSNKILIPLMFCIFNYYLQIIEIFQYHPNNKENAKIRSRFFSPRFFSNCFKNKIIHLFLLIFTK